MKKLMYDTFIECSRHGQIAARYHEIFLQRRHRNRKMIARIAATLSGNVKLQGSEKLYLLNVRTFDAKFDELYYYCMYMIILTLQMRLEFWELVKLFVGHTSTP